ncbi:hypothetical protein BJ170DRAFT_402963 [Xylariales sp. AK1849]|nr:hypothetical protein BJ170DRAFT_402963 [Xylariales sp. AK1849]
MPHAHSATGQWSPENNTSKHAVVEVAELYPESASGRSGSYDGSHAASENVAQPRPDEEDHSFSGKQHDTTTERISHHDRNSQLFDEKHDTQAIDPDVTIDTVLEGSISHRSPPPPRRPISSGQFCTAGDGTQGLDTSSAPQHGQQRKIYVPKRRERISSFSPTSYAGRRTLSTETTATNLGAGSRTSSTLATLKSLPLEERLVKAYSSMKELQYACALPPSHERVPIQRVFDLIDKIRMRKVPHQWSAVDRRLKQVQASAERIAGFVALVKDHGSDADGVASMFFACCELSLQGGQVLESLCLDNLLSIFHRVGAVLQHVELSVPEGVTSQKLDAAFAKMTQVLQHICVGFVEMLDELKTKCASLSLEAFSHQVNKFFEADLESLSAAALDACQHVWSLSLGGSPDTSLRFCHGHVLEWLGIHHHHPHHDPHRLPRGHEFGEASSFIFDCVEPLIAKFFKTPSRILFVTGDAGYGEQEMASNLIERLQVSLPSDAKLLRASLASTYGSVYSTTRLLKSLLRQLLDQSVGNTSLLSAINDLSKRSEHESVARMEDLLWGLLTAQCSNVTGNIALVINAVSPSEGACTNDEFLSKLQQLTSKCGNVRCLTLTHPEAAHAISDVQVYTLSQADIRRNARLFLQGAIAASSTLSVLSARIRQDLLRHIAERQWTSLLEAKLILRLLESKHDLAHLPVIIRETPKTVQGILDHMLLKIDYKNSEMRTLLSWLLVSKRPVQVLELEKHGSVSVRNWLRRIQLGRPVSSNGSLAGVLTVRNGRVQFLDSQVKARMHQMSAHGKIPLSLHVCHRLVALDCLRHAREFFSQHKADLVFQNPLRTKWASTSSYAKFDSMLVYAVNEWYDHYERSLTSSEKLSRHVPPEMSSLLPDSVLMSLAEWHYSRTEHLDSPEMLSKISAMRKTVFGPHAPSVIQTTIILAHCGKHLGSVAHKANLEKLIESFEGAVATYGDPSSQATSGAKYIFSIVDPQTILPSQGSKVCRYLWGVHRRELGDSHDETLLVAQRLAELYTVELRFAQAAEVLHDIYDACRRTRGPFASRTIELFHLLVDALEHADNMNDAQQLCQDVFDAASGLEKWNEAVLSAVLRIVHHYQDRGMSDVSKTKLHQLWNLLRGQFKKRNDQTDLFVSFTSISLQLATKLRDLSLECDATSTLGAFWVLGSKYMTADPKVDMAVLVQLRELAQLLLRLDQHQKALSILRVLYDYHQSHSLHGHSGEMLQVYSVLVACYRGVDNPINEFLWLNILDSILLAMDSCDAETVFLCRDLAVLHRSRGQQATAISICRRSLEVFWPHILSHTGELLCLPERYASEFVSLVVIMAQLYKLTGDEQRAKVLLGSVVRCCKQHVLRWDTSCEDVATTLSAALEEAELYLEALHFWKSILGECSSHFGRFHHFTLQIAAVIARLSLQLELDIDDEGVCGVFEAEPEDDDLESISMLIEGLLALCRSSGSRKRGQVVLRWYERLWSYYFDLRHDLAMDPARGFEIFQGYSAVLLSMQNVSVAIRLARKLRATCMSDFGRQDIWYLRASLELTKLLEMDETTVLEAVDVYDNIIEICFGLSTTDEAILSILRTAEEHLSVLVSSKPVLHGRAEQLLAKAWTQAHRKHGYAHERAIACLQKLLNFWLAAGMQENGEEALKEAVLGAVAQEKKPRKLFHTAQHFSGMYQMFGLSFRDVSYLGSIRAELSKRTRKGHQQCGQAQGWYDRRCLVLVYSMAAMLQHKKQDDLFSEILTRVMSETALYEAWLRARLEDHPLDGLLASGTRLIQYLELYQLDAEAHEIQNELWDAFCRCLGRPNKKGDSACRLFQAIMTASREETASTSLLEVILATARELADVGNRQACLLVSQWVYGHAQTYADLSDSSFALILLKLSTLLYTCSESEASTGLGRSIEELATMMGVLAMTETAEVDLSVMSINHLSFILTVAGRQKDYRTLKQILELLWTSRDNHDFHLSSRTTIAIGKRLAEVHFACGEHAAAFTLLEDIAYNLKDVYGVNHPMSLHCQSLLASMHEKLGHRKPAIDTRFAMLRDALWGRDDGELGEAHVGGQLDESVATYVQQLRSLRCGYAAVAAAEEAAEEDDVLQHLEQNREYLEEIIGRVKRLTVICKAGHKTGDLLELDGWKGLNRFEVDQETFDVWCEPKDWTVELERDVEEEGYESACSVTDA